MAVLQLIGSVGLILGTWVVLSLLLAGVGLAARRAFGSHRTDANSLWQDFWMGLSLTLLALQLWHLILPVNWLPLCLLVVLGSLSLLRSRRQVGGILLELGLADKAAAAVTLVVWLWFANRAMSPPLLYDTGMYHMPVVVWSKAYAIVPGLGNLHGRLAFNNSNLLFGAMLDAGLWSGRAVHITSGLLLFVLAGRFIPAGMRLAHRSARRVDAFDVLLLAGIVHLALTQQFISYSPDLAVTASVFAAGSMLYRWLTDRSRQDADNYSLIVVSILLIASVTIKLTILGFAAPAAILAMGVWLRIPGDPAGKRRTGLWLGVIGTALICVWLARGVLLSGFPAYPSTVLGFDVDWRVPELQAEAEYAWTGEWGRTRDLELVNQNANAPGAWSAWATALFRPTSEAPGNLWSVGIPLLFTVLFVPFALLHKRGGWGGADGRGWLLFIAGMMGVAFWLATTAVIRHGQPVVWLLAATTAGQLLVDRPARSRGRWQTFVVTTSLVIAVSALAQFSMRLMISDSVPWWGAVGGLVTRPGTGLGLYGVPVPAVESYTTESGLVLAVPTADNRCWAVDPPCTPHPAPNLRLRVPGDLGSGFATDGVWRQERWPNPKSNFRERFLRNREADER